MKSFIEMFWRDERGQDLIEYSLLLAFLCLFAVASFTTINGHLSTIWTGAGTAAGQAAAMVP